MPAPKPSSQPSRRQVAISLPASSRIAERSGYTAIGTVCNLAARLCAEAKDGQILISSRVARAVEAIARLEDLGNLDLKGLRRPIAAFNVLQSTSQSGGGSSQFERRRQRSSDLIPGQREGLKATRLGRSLVPPWRSAVGAKPEAADFKHGLPLSADTGRSF